MSTRVDAGSRLLRLLAVLSWLARRGRVPVSELSERFGITPDELVADLELAACCGVPPYTPDQLMEIIVDEHEVVANLGAELARPRRLTAAEGFALAASARAISAVPGADPDGALRRALAKLDAVLGDRGQLRIDVREPAHLALIRAAAQAGEQFELRYYSASSDHESLRVVDPAEVVAIEGRWYLDGFCHRAEGMRRFRVDRVSEARRTGQPSCHGRPGAGDDAASGTARGRATRRSRPGPRPRWRTSPWTARPAGSSRRSPPSAPSPCPTVAPGSRWPSPARCGSGACCCASARTPRCSTHPSSPTPGGAAAAQVLARYRPGAA